VRKGFTRDLEPPPRALLRRQDLETGRPPAGLDRLDELAREPFAPHLARQARMVVVHGDELDGDFARALLEDREPHIRPSVVRGAPKRPHVDDAPARAPEALPLE